MSTNPAANQSARLSVVIPKGENTMTRVINKLVEVPGAEVVPLFTIHKDDRDRAGVWTHVNGGNLFFMETQYPGAKLHDGKGALAGAVAGNPVQLIYWGSWWGTPDGVLQRTTIDAAVQGLLLSPYFRELQQYRIIHAPAWRGDSLAITVSEPDVHLHGDTAKDFNAACRSLVQDLIFEGQFANPKDGTHVCFIALMPPGFHASNADGSHSNRYEWDVPFDFQGNLWAGWVQYEDANATVRDLGHELVEMLTDPSGDGWRWKPEPVEDVITEIADGRELMTAWVGGANVQAYWSQRHAADVIPLDTDYGAQLTASIKETSRRIAAHNTRFARPEDSAACSPSLPECCFDGERYEFRVYSTDEIARVRLHVRRFRQPSVVWRINGTEVSGEGDLPPLDLPVLSITGAGDPMPDRKQVALHCKPVTVGTDVRLEWTPFGLDIQAVGVDANFEIDVTCTVTETAFTGSAIGAPVAQCGITVDFVCTEMLMAEAYLDKLSRCYASMLKRFVHLYKPTGKPGKDEPINEIADLLSEVALPAYVRPSAYADIMQAMKLARAANALLEKREATAFTRALIQRLPALRVAEMNLRERPAHRG